MSYGLTLNTAPAIEPVTTAEARRQCHVSDDIGGYHDNKLDQLVTAARLYVERYTNRQLITATWTLVLDRFPMPEWGTGLFSPIYVPLAPLQSISSITYLDTAGATQTWTSTKYRVSIDREPARIVPAYGEIYPTTRTTTDTVSIRFVAGYGATTATVPLALRQAILLLVGHWFENREAVGNVGSTVEMALTSLLDSYRVGDEFTNYGPPLYLNAGAW
jgi:uncharacterized phiE125 gp8 family phage protein